MLSTIGGGRSDRHQPGATETETREAGDRRPEPSTELNPVLNCYVKGSMVGAMHGRCWTEE
jgi:hypothetical protein